MAVRALGQFLIDRGEIDADQLREALELTETRAVPIGEALVHLEHCSSDRMQTLLEAFQVDQAQYARLHLVATPCLAEHPVAAVAMALCPRLLLRMAQLPSRLAPLVAYQGDLDFADYAVAVDTSDQAALRIGIAGDREFAQAVAAAVSGLEEPDLKPAWVADGLGEFLNVLVGSSAGVLARRGRALTFTAPDVEARLAGGWRADLALETGRGALLFEEA